MMGWGLTVIPAFAGIQGHSCTLQMPILQPFWIPAQGRNDETGFPVIMSNQSYHYDGGEKQSLLLSHFTQCSGL